MEKRPVRLAAHNVAFIMMAASVIWAQDTDEGTDREIAEDLAFGASGMLLTSKPSEPA